MSNSELSVTNLPKCLNGLLNIPLKKSSWKTQQGELQTLTSACIVSPEPAVSRPNGHCSHCIWLPLLRKVHQLTWNHKKCNAKHILHLHTFKFLPFCGFSLLIRHGSKRKWFVKAHGKANSKRRGETGERGSESVYHIALQATSITFSWRLLVFNVSLYIKFLTYIAPEVVYLAWHPLAHARRQY